MITIIMVEREVELQAAIELVVAMLSEYIIKYQELRDTVPSFGEVIDTQLNKYLDAITSSLQGIAIWYYTSPSTCFQIISCDIHWVLMTI